MKLTDKTGLTIDVPYQPAILSFVFDDCEIRNPFLSECGRFSVDPAKHYGFEAVMTGGGCEALVVNLENGDCLMLTDDGGTGLPDNDDYEDAMIGRYNQEGEMIVVTSIRDIPGYDDALEEDKIPNRINSAKNEKTSSQKKRAVKDESEGLEP